MTKVGPKLLSRLVSEYSSALVLYARQLCRNPEDVVQEAFLQLMRQAELPNNVRAWLYRVVRNSAISAAHSATRRRRHESVAAHRGEPWFDSTDERRLDASTATDALGQLPLEQRETIVARVWGGLSYDEIAEVTGSTRSTVFRRYQAGLSTLRERFGVACPHENNRMKS